MTISPAYYSSTVLELFHLQVLTITNNTVVLLPFNSCLISFPCHFLPTRSFITMVNTSTTQVCPIFPQDFGGFCLYILLLFCSVHTSSFCYIFFYGLVFFIMQYPFLISINASILNCILVYVNNALYSSPPDPCWFGN